MPEVEEEAVTALIRRTPLRRTRMKAWHPKPDPEHDAATQLARVSAPIEERRQEALVKLEARAPLWSWRRANR